MDNRRYLLILILFVLTTLYFVLYNFSNLKSYNSLVNYKNYLLNVSNENYAAFEQQQNQTNSIEIFKFNTSSIEGKYKFTLEPNKSMCISYNQSNKLLLFIYVLVSADFFKNRQTIRETWANSSIMAFNYKIIFSIGLSKQEDVNRKIKEEHKIYNDILQSDFVDSYHLLIDKNMMVFEWISKYCSRTHFLLKIMDDVVVNMKALVEFLNDHIRNKNQIQNIIMGMIFHSSIPFRNPKDKWYVSFEEYNKTYFDPFPSGPAFLLSYDVSQSMYEKSLTFKSVWMDDVYIGMLAKQLNTYLYDIKYAYVPKDHYARLSLLQKLNLIQENNIKKTLFVYAKEHDYQQVWDFLKLHQK
jgi:hypothetical protein